MDLGAFSVSLAVKDIVVSQAFYSKLGFKPFAGNIEEKWLMLRNGDHVIGLFQDKFDANILTFNPGWDQQCQGSESFTDVREIQQGLLKEGVSLVSQADPATTGPAFITMIDPDGNPILIDQHR